MAEPIASHRRGDPIPVHEVARIVRGWPGLAGYGPHIAELFKVPVATAHRWVAETRRRGLLPATGQHACPTCGGSGVRTYGKKRTSDAPGVSE